MTTRLAAMPEAPLDQSNPPENPAPRAFTQGVGTVFQFVGVTLFLSMMFVCCASSLLGKQAAMRKDLQEIGLRHPASGIVLYSAQQAITICVTCGVFFGVALASIGLGLQAQNRRSPWLAVGLTLFGSLFWIFHAALFAFPIGSPTLTILSTLLGILFVILLCLSVASLREMLRTPPPIGHEILPPDYKVPYSHMYQDPPEVRLARELEQRRARMAVQQKELELLEEKLNRKLQQSRENDMKKDGD